MLHLTLLLYCELVFFLAMLHCIVDILHLRHSKKVWYLCYVFIYNKGIFHHTYLYKYTISSFTNKLLKEHCAFLLVNIQSTSDLLFQGLLKGVTDTSKILLVLQTTVEEFSAFKKLSDKSFLWNLILKMAPCVLEFLWRYCWRWINYCKIICQSVCKLHVYHIQKHLFYRRRDVESGDRVKRGIRLESLHSHKRTKSKLPWVPLTLI